jgi:uncharacterized RDD family membrane protein YckC
VIAFIVDFLVVVVPPVVLLGVLGIGIAGAAGSDDDAGLGALIGGVLLTVLLAAVIALIYAPLTMMRGGRHNGQTLGKQWMSIRVVRDEGVPFGWGWAFLRELVIKGIGLSIASSIASTITFFLLGAGGIIPYVLDYLWPLWDDQNRAVHDMVARTHVVQA